MGLTAIVVSQAITPSEALEGFASTGVTTFTVLSIDAGGIQQVSVVLPIFCRMLGKPNTLWVAQVYLMDPIARSSAFLNNTLVVALNIFAVEAWSGRWFPLSELLIRSAAIRRGTMTLLGSSTNLVVDGLAKKSHTIGLDGRELHPSVPPWVMWLTCCQAVLSTSNTIASLMPLEDIQDSSHWRVEVRPFARCHLPTLVLCIRNWLDYIKLRHGERQVAQG
jgi:hypothetical protein